jgi:uncharacterized protein
MQAFVIDAFEFCQVKDCREGDIAVADLPRLATDTVDRAGQVSWVLQGGIDRSGHSRLNLSVSATVHLMCQRCLTPLAYKVASESTLILAKDEAGIDEIEAMLPDDSIDVIAGGQSLNVAELIEDEVLLAIPQSPKHEVCPDQAALEALKGAKKPSPFDVLKNIKQ